MKNIESQVKIFSDGADLNSMLAMAKDPKIKGITTNPSLLKKALVTDYRSYAKQVLSQITNKPISFEVFADPIEEMRRQALEIGSWAHNVYVKIPITNAEGISTAPLIQELSHKNIKLNITAILTLEQVLIACQALKGGAPSLVSVFAGRIADTGRDPIPLMGAALEICRTFDKNIELLWASCRELFNIVQAASIGCHVITVPPDLIKKLPTFGKDLTAVSLETVRAFKEDASSAGFSL